VAELDIPITVTGLQGRPIATTAPADGQALSWSAAGGVWTPITPPFLPLAGGAITGNLTVGGTLSVSGNATMGGTLSVSGNATFSSSGPVNIDGGLVLPNPAPAGYVNASGNISAGGTIAATGVIYANGGIHNSSGADVITNKGYGYASINGYYTSSSTAVMLGSNCSFGPRVSGNFLCVIGGQFSFNDTSSYCTLYLRYGLGSPPASNAPLQGNLFYGSQGAVSLQQNPHNAGATSAFIMNGLITGLTLGSTYWVDLGFENAAGSGSTLTISQATISIMEI
jgi:hypothetical protein